MNTRLLGGSRVVALQRIGVFTAGLVVLAAGGLLAGMAVAVRGAKPRLDFGAAWAVNSVAWSPDGRQLASGSSNQTVKEWDARTGQLQRTLTGHSRGVNSVAWSPDGRQLASGSDDNTVKVWDARTGQLQRTLTGHSDTVISVGWSPDGRQLASGSHDNTVKVWDAGTGQLQRTLTGHSQLVNSVAWSPDGRQLASGSWDNTLKVWDAGTGQLQRTLTGHSERVNSVAWSPDGRQLASGSYDNTVKVWDAGTGQLQCTLTGHIRDVTSVAWSADGRQLASGSWDETVKVWDAGTGQLQRTLTVSESSGVDSVVWSPDGRQLASGSGENTVKVRDAGTGQLQCTLTGHIRDVTSVAWSADGRQLASGSWDETVKVWDAGTGQLQRTLTGHSGIVTSVEWSPDGRQLASGSWDNTVKMWDARTGQLQRTLTGHSAIVTSVAWSPDGRQLASGSNNWTVKVWAARTGQLQRTLTGHRGDVSSVAWSADGRQLVSGSDDHTVKVWDARTGQLQRTLTGHFKEVLSVARSPDGRQLASGSSDSTVKVWDAGTGRLQRTLTQHALGVSSVAWSPDGRQLASGSIDGTVGVWDRDDAESGYLLANLKDPEKRLLINPGNLRYESLGGPEAFVEVSFGPDWTSRYRLSDLPATLQVRNVREASREELDVFPGVLTESAAYVRQRRGTIGIVCLVYLVGVGGLLLGMRPMTAEQVAKRFFPKAGLPIERALGTEALALPGAFAATWPQPEDQIVEAIARQRRGQTGRYRTYLVGREIDPDVVRRLSGRLQCEVIPLAAAGLERGLADDKAKETLREMEEPFVTRTDPYDESRAVTDPTWFYGRTAMLGELPPVLRQGQHVGVFGLRKIGKTSLLSQLRLRLIDVPMVWLDCQAYEPLAVDLLREILTRLRREVARLQGKQLRDRQPGGDNLNQLRDQLVALHEQWRKTSSERFIVILDEIDKWFPDRREASSEPALTEYVKLFRILRAVAQERGGMLSILVAGYWPDMNRQNLLREATGENPMYLSYQEKFVGCLREDEARKMIREIGQWKDIAWTDDALD
ncbi:MAG: hypothetical protein FJW39_13890, partial [Acidobacteria bacterium]|nr:hypothetical protein [Acidobacteriota bacterium]